MARLLGTTIFSTLVMVLLTLLQYPPAGLCIDTTGMAPPMPPTPESHGSNPPTTATKSIDTSSTYPVPSYNCKDLVFKDKNSGVFYSPNYPADYPNYAICFYQILVPEGNIVELAIHDLKTEPPNDKIEVYDGYAEFDEKGNFKGTAPKLLRKFFKTLKSYKEGVDQDKKSRRDLLLVRSSGRGMTVKFSTDFINTMRGFYARFDAVPANDGKNPSCAACPGDNEFTAEMGVLVSPKWPHMYQAMASCFYYITVAEGKKIELRVNYFRTEASSDILKVYNATEVTYMPYFGKQDHLRLSGELEEDEKVLSTGNKMKLQFYSDMETEDEGFSIRYTTID